MHRAPSAANVERCRGDGPQARASLRGCGPCIRALGSRTDPAMSRARISAKWVGELVGASRFERPTSCSQGRRATRLRHAPTSLSYITLQSGWLPASEPCGQPADKPATPSEWPLSQKPGDERTGALDAAWYWQMLCG